MAGRVFAHQDEIARVGDQDETVTLPIPADLGAVRSQPRVVAGGFDLNDTPFGDLTLLGLVFL